jgi:aspartate-semialdehyde dehydrogenase
VDNRIPVAVLGATGMVGARLVSMVARHPWFRLAEAAASERSAGGPLGALLSGDGGEDLPSEVAAIEVTAVGERLSSPLLLSALPSGVAREVEADAARNGQLVVSNASAYRDDPQVPLVIPEVNPDHLDLLDAQKERWSGGIVTNPNCVVAGLATALAPLYEAFGLERVVVTTFQAISGAGRPGPAAFDLVDNVLPYIAGEEPKIAAEPRKILGKVRDGSVVEAVFRLGATAVRVPVRHGHLVSVSCALSRGAGADAAAQAMRAWAGAVAGRGRPSAPVRPLEVLDADDRPQPLLDRDRGAGMTVTVGRVRPCEALGLSFLVLSHNLVRGAAGAALLNAELCRARGLV